MSSGPAAALRKDWSKCFIIILWSACAVLLLISFYQTIKEACLTLRQDPTQIFRRRPRRRHQSDTVAHEPSMQSESRGLASAFIHSLPSIQFCGEIKGGDNHGNAECAVCLGEFLEGEWLRLLPNCGHVFHATCIDTWFGSHANCPLCRTSVLNGFNVCGSSGPTLSLMHSLPREGMHQERPPSYWLDSIVPFEDVSVNSESRTEAANISSSAHSDVNHVSSHWFCFYLAAKKMATLPSWVSTLHNKFSNSTAHSAVIPVSTIKACSREVSLNDNGLGKRRLLLLGASALTSTILKPGFAFAEEVPEKYRAFVDTEDGYSYYYPEDWRDFDFLGHDSAFKDRFAALQHVRVGFIPTEKKDIRDLGPMDEVIFDLVKNVYAAPNQIPTIYEMQERTVDGKNYWTFEYQLESEAFARTAFATIAIGNGRYYTLVVGANERRWSRLRNRLKVVADSFKMIDI
ncbi:hypothetical protein J5N97_014966 [Dioscorea zingiberensis]|uniref:RING-type E3 ubiquitin transferase n=1 Tax=Dioscorea zingiberensis TaxID=325984 RepID=A0A9D5CUX3_9LILI|nr:hypothetical protein J5N97_014966 [Dioscorea zingiberensis]